MSALRSRCLVIYFLAGWLSAFASSAVAQTSNMVLLEAPDSSASISGELVEASNGQYKLSTSAGDLSVDIDAVDCSGDACPPVVPDFEQGAEVELSSADGGFNVMGTITDIVDGQYVVESAVLGSIQLNVDLVDCSGPGCPTGLRFEDDSAEVAAPAAGVPVATDTAAITESELDGSEQYDPANADFSFVGSDTVGIGLLPYLLDDYADTLGLTAETDSISETETVVSYTGADKSEVLSVYVNATGSGDAVNALANESAVFGMTSRPIDDDEAGLLAISGTGDLRNGDYETVIAVDSVAVIVHPSNPVTQLSMAEIAAIYLGEIANWSQVGGPDAVITVLSREDGSSTRGVFENAIFDGEELTLAQSVVYPGGDNPEMAAAVKANPLAIGYVGFAYSEGLRRLDLTSECGITSKATNFAVKTEEYAFGRRLYLYSRADNTPAEAERFLGYVLSPDADDAIAQSSFVNFAVERSPQNASRIETLFSSVSSEAEQRLADRMVEDLRLWDRLSTTVRFRPGSSRLGNKELNDIERLISTLSELPEGTRVAAVGFTDDVGGFENNRALSARRAASVSNAINSNAEGLASSFQIETRAYSELAPSVCNADSNSRAINRRVEIWVQK